MKVRIDIYYYEKLSSYYTSKIYYSNIYIIIYIIIKLRKLSKRNEEEKAVFICNCGYLSNSDSSEDSLLSILSKES